MGIGSTAPRAGVCENRCRSKCSSASWLQEETDGAAGALHEIVLSVQMQTQGRMLSLSQQNPQRGSAKPSMLMTGAGSESIYTLAQGGIFVQSLSEHWSHGAVIKPWLYNRERQC